MLAGIYKDLSNDEYHADTESISRSAIMDFLDSPYKYWANYLDDNKPCRTVSRPMIIGAAFHTLILEPEKFDDLYVPEPPKVLLKNVGRVEYDRYKELCAYLEMSNKIVLTDEEYLTLLKMKETLMSNSNANALFNDSLCEQSYFWQDKDSEFLLKARPDALQSNMIIDLKTCRNASYREFQNAMIYGGYHIQGAMIQDAIYALEGIWIDTVVNVAIETTYPHAIGIYVLDSEALELGRSRYKNALINMRECKQKDKWQDYGIQLLAVPKWAM